ncbi:polyprenyl synthetase family protein [Streptomyces cinereoruber]|uniref:polyprenyl synthetase family protein n=1 Tax=Streptomyces cinereoruber TaxID=67260 RepID=UPI003634B006
MPDPLQVDEGVPAAVEEHLAAVLRRRAADAADADPDFAADIADRVAAFALGGGRRLRAEFLWWAMRGSGGGARETPASLGVAAALELVQTCALIHDDVMDGSPLRRGRPSVHVQLDARFGTAERALPCGTFGGAAAVLAGDLALAWADDAFAEAVAALPSAPRAAGVWRVMRTEMVAGQYLDLRAQVTGDASADRAARTAVLKTALYSMGHPLALGATLAGAPEGTVRALREAGRSAGLAFQLHDDVRGAFGDPAATGKPVGEDIREGKATYLLAVAGERCAELGDRAGLGLLQRITGGARTTEEDVDRALDLLVSCGARDRVARRVEELCARGAETVARAGLTRDAADRIGELFGAACGLEAGAGRAAAPAPAPGLGRATGPASAPGRTTGPAPEPGRATGPAPGTDRATAPDPGRATAPAPTPGRAAAPAPAPAPDPGHTTPSAPEPPEPPAPSAPAVPPTFPALIGEVR